MKQSESINSVNVCFLALPNPLNSLITAIVSQGKTYSALLEETIRSKVKKSKSHSLTLYIHGLGHITLHLPEMLKRLFSVDNKY